MSTPVIIIFDLFSRSGLDVHHSNSVVSESTEADISIRCDTDEIMRSVRLLKWDRRSVLLVEDIEIGEVLTLLGIAMLPHSMPLPVALDDLSAGLAPARSASVTNRHLLLPKLHMLPLNVPPVMPLAHGLELGVLIAGV